MKEIKFDFWSWGNDITLKKLREDIDKLEKLGVTHVRMLAVQEVGAYDEYYPELEITALKK